MTFVALGSQDVMQHDMLTQCVWREHISVEASFCEVSKCPCNFLQAVSQP